MEISSAIIIVGLVFVVPAIVNLRHYLVVRSINYLYFSLFFVFTVLNLFNLEHERDSTFHWMINILTYAGTIYFLVRVSLDTYRRPRGDILNATTILLGFYVSISAVIVIMFDLKPWNEGGIEILRLLLEELLRVFASGVVIFGFYKSPTLLKSPKIEFIKWTWVTLGIFYGIAGTIRYLLFTIIFFRFTINGTSVPEPILLTTTTIFITAVSIPSLWILFVAIFLPQSMLLTELQVMRANRLYELSQRFTEQDLTLNAPRSSANSLISYIQELPKELFEQNPPS